MGASKKFLKISVLTWSVMLGLLFIGGTVAVSMLGTKSNGTFTTVGVGKAAPGPAAAPATPAPGPSDRATTP